MYRRLQQPTCVATISDASGSTKRTSYAVEGRLVCRKEDRLVWEAEGSFAAHLWNGRARVLTHAGKKSKRVSQSTSHGEALSHFGVSVEAEVVAMRLTEMSSPRQLSLRLV